MKLPTARAGFTLLEILLAMTILFLGMTAVLGFLSVGAALARTAQLRGASAQAVEAVLADLEENAFRLPGDGADPASEASGSSGPATEVRLAEGAALAGAPQEIRARPVPGYPGLRYDARFTAEPASVEATFVLGDAGALYVPPVEYRVDVELSWSQSGRRRTKRFTTLLVGEVPFGERMRRTFLERADDPARSQRRDDR